MQSRAVRARREDSLRLRKDLLFLSSGLLATAPLLTSEVPARAELTVIEGAAHAVSAPLRDFIPFGPGLPSQAANVIAIRKAGGSKPEGGGGGGGSWTDGDLQSSYGSFSLGGPLNSFDGIGANGSIPPDTNLAVGATQVVETVNTDFAIYGKNGTLIAGPAPIHTIFSALANTNTAGNMCATADGGDPIVLYDKLAGRWLISQMQYNTNFSTNVVCIAVSQTSDALGTFALYAFNFGSSLPDYPKFGVWSDAYYFSANMFRRGSTFSGAQACAFNRAAMLSAQPAVGICFQSSSLYNLLPSDLDGTTPPPAGAPNPFLQFVAPGTLSLYRFHVDFVNTGNSTFTSGGNLAVQTFHEACGGGACIPQLGTNTQLDSLADRLMYRLSYRNFGSYESLLVNHSVQVKSSSSQTGIRWYEIRNPNGSPSVYQQSTFSPDGTYYRWMGSMAQDKQGNMLLQYSTSSSGSYPSIGYTGRTAGDPVNQMMIGATFFAGSGSQTTYSRWGDYTSVAVDPADDCTFWFANEYLPSTGVFNWKTRIGSTKFSGCN
jgi:hypothetical protein